MTIVVNGVIVLDVKLLRERLRSNSKTRTSSMQSVQFLRSLSQNKTKDGSTRKRTFEHYWKHLENVQLRTSRFETF